MQSNAKLHLQKTECQLTQPPVRISTQSSQTDEKNTEKKKKKKVKSRFDFDLTARAKTKTRWMWGER